MEWLIFVILGILDSKVFKYDLANCRKKICVGGDIFVPLRSNCFIINKSTRIFTKVAELKDYEHS